MCTAGQRVLLTNTGPAPSFNTSWLFYLISILYFPFDLDTTGTENEKLKEGEFSSKKGKKKVRMEVLFSVQNSAIKVDGKKGKKKAGQSNVGEDNESIQCEKCGHACRNRSSWRTHVRQYHPSQVYQCSSCSYSTGWSHRYHDHMRIHNREYPLKCPHCDYATIRSSQLKDHIVSRHTSNKNYKCPHCNFAAKLKGYLRNHIHRIHRATEISFRCDKCDYSTATKQNLTNHSLIHQVEKPLRCPDDGCQKSFTSVKSLNSHVRNKTRNFLCNKCDTKCSTLRDLAKHSKGHSGVKDNVCRICQAKYSHLYGLYKHFKAKHEGHLPFHCEQCDFFASDVRIFKNHKNSLEHLGQSN